MRKSKQEIKKHLKTNDNEDTTTLNLWNGAKAVLRGKFIAIQAFFKNEEKYKIVNINHHINELEKEEQTKPKVSRRKEIKEEINKVGIKETIEKNQ